MHVLQCPPICAALTVNVKQNFTSLGNDFFTLYEVRSFGGTIFEKPYFIVFSQTKSGSFLGFHEPFFIIS